MFISKRKFENMQTHINFLTNEYHEKLKLNKQLIDEVRKLSEQLLIENLRAMDVYLKNLNEKNNLKLLTNTALMELILNLKHQGFLKD